MSRCAWPPRRRPVGRRYPSSCRSCVAHVNRAASSAALSGGSSARDPGPDADPAPDPAAAAPRCGVAARAGSLGRPRRAAWGDLVSDPANSL